MRLFLPAFLVAATTAAAVATRTTSQSQDIRLTPFSEFRGQTAYEGAESPDGRFFVTSDEDDHLVVFDRRRNQWATDSSLKPRQIRWSPDGRFLAFAASTQGTRDRYVWMVPMDSGTGRPRGTARRLTMRPAGWPAWSPDGRRIAFVEYDSSGARVVAVPFNGGDGETLLARKVIGPPNYSALFWSPDGNTIITPGLTMWLRINVRTRALDSIPLPPMGVVGYSRDGTQIAQFSYQDGLIVISRASDGREVRRLNAPYRAFPTGWSATAPNALTALHNPIPGDVRRVSLPDGRLSTLLPDAEGLTSVQYSPDGKLVAYVRAVGASYELWVMGSDGSNPHRVGNPGVIADYRWSPDGARIAYETRGVNQGLHLVDVASGSDRQVVAATGEAVFGRSLGWRNDGQAIRYTWRPRGLASPEREAREATLSGQVRTLANIPIVAADLNTNRATVPIFAGDSLVLLQNRARISAVSLATGASRIVYTGENLHTPGISRDGQWIAITAWANGLASPTLVSLATGEQRRIPYALGAELLDVRFHPDGRNLVAMACTQCNNDERWDLVVIPMNGDPTRMLTAGERGYRAFNTFSIAPDGRSVVFDGEKTWRMRLVTLTLPTLTTAPPGK